MLDRNPKWLYITSLNMGTLIEMYQMVHSDHEFIVTAPAYIEVKLSQNSFVAMIFDDTVSLNDFTLFNMALDQGFVPRLPRILLTQKRKTCARMGPAMIYNTNDEPDVFYDFMDALTRGGGAHQTIHRNL